MTSENSAGPTRTKVKSYEDVLHEELRDPRQTGRRLPHGGARGFAGGVPAWRCCSVADAHGGLGTCGREATQLNRQTLYRTLSGQGNPTLATLQSVLREVGLTLAFAPAAQATGSTGLRTTRVSDNSFTPTGTITAR